MGRKTVHPLWRLVGSLAPPALRLVHRGRCILPPPRGIFDSESQFETGSGKSSRHETLARIEDVLVGSRGIGCGAGLRFVFSGIDRVWALDPAGTSWNFAQDTLGVDRNSVQPAASSERRAPIRECVPPFYFALFDLLGTALSAGGNALFYLVRQRVWDMADRPRQHDSYRRQLDHLRSGRLPDRGRFLDSPLARCLDCLGRVDLLRRHLLRPAAAERAHFLGRPPVRRRRRFLGGRASAPEVSAKSIDL